ncbi:MAG: hypothetical protein ACYTEQ_29580, partial [Planctomycetota bacterium]
MESLKKVIGFVIGFAVVSLAIHFIRGGDKLKAFEPFRSHEGRFSVMFPGKPKKTLQSVNTPAGEIAVVTFFAGSKESGFAVGYSDYPQQAIDASDPVQMLDGARDGAVTNAGGELEDENVIDFHGRPAREIQIRVPDKINIRARLILIDNRLYQVMVLSPSPLFIDQKA